MPKKALNCIIHTMDEFCPSLFFSLQRYEHKTLWKKGQPVWSALHELKNYLSQRKQHRIEITIPSRVHLERPELISIGKGTVIEPGVLIRGPCIIGKECIIRHGAYLRDFVICGDRCAIGHSAELKNCILLDFANATHFVYVGDSILGNNVNLGAGVKCANIRLDRKEIVIVNKEEKIKTGLKKMGAIIGDSCQIGCNAVLNPGTLIGPESLCPGLVSLGGIIPAKSQIKQAVNWTSEPLKQQFLDQMKW